MKLAGVLAIASVFVFSFTAVADEELSPGYNACMAASGGVTVQMRKCQNDAFIYLDGKLNKIYKQAMLSCNDEGDSKACKNTILKMQRAWIKYKEATVDYLFMALGDGTLTPVAVDDFVNQTTKDQVKKLELMLNR